MRLPTRRFRSAADGRRPRIGGPLAAFAVFGAFWGGWAALLPAIRAEIGASEAQLGAALLFVGLGALPAMVLTGLAIDRLGPLVAPVLVVFACAVTLPAFASSVPQLAVVLAVVGAASGALDVAINAAVSGIEATTSRRLMQAAHALFSAGVVAGSISVGLARSAGATADEVLPALAALIVLVAALNVRRPARPPGRSAGGLELSRRLVALGVVCAIAFVFESGVESWSALFLEQNLSAAPATSGLGPGLFAAAMAAGRTLGQGIGGRVGDRALLAAGAVAGGIGVLVAAASHRQAIALAGFAMAGAGISVAAPILFGDAGRGVSDERRGRAVATVTTISYLGFLVGPAIMGGVAGLLGLRASWLVLAAVAGVVALSAGRLPLVPPRRPV